MLSKMFIEPNSAPSWNSRPNFLRISNSSSSVMFGHRLAVDEDVAGVGVEQADDVLDQHALAGSRRAEDHRDLVVGKAEVEAVEDPRAAELLDDVDDLDRVLAAVVALLARVPAVGVRSRRVDARDRCSPCAACRARARAPRRRPSSSPRLADRVGEAVLARARLGGPGRSSGSVLGDSPRRRVGLASLVRSSSVIAPTSCLVSLRSAPSGWRPRRPASPSSR